MTNLTWLLLPGILYLGILASYTDIRYGKIRNKAVLRAIIYALVVYALAIIFFAIKGTLSGRYVAELGTNALFAGAVCVLLWLMKVWSAGDGKLFFAFALLIPPEAYQYQRYGWTPSVTFLFNIFLVGLLYLVILMLKTASWKNYQKAFEVFLKRLFKPREFFKSIVSLFAVFWISGILLSLIGQGNNLLLKFLVTMVIFSQIPRLFSWTKVQNPEVYIAGAIAALRLATDISVYSLSFAMDFALLVFVWGLTRNVFRGMLHSLGKELFSKRVKVSGLNPGMMLSGVISKVAKLDRRREKKIIENDGIVVDRGKFSYVLGERQIEKACLRTESEGMTEKDIKLIKKMGFKFVNVSSTMSFAPIIFLGALATLLAKGNILIVLWNLF